MSRVIKAVASLLVVVSVIAINPIQANASTGGWRGSYTSGWWYEDGKGSYYTDWKYIDGQWFFFNEKGWMLRNTWVGGYQLGDNGAWVSDSNSHAEYFKKADVHGKLTTGSNGRLSENMQRSGN